MKSRWQTIKENLSDPNSVKPWDIINPETEWATDEVKDFRYDICKKCPEFLSATTQCKQCGCIMKIKTRMAQATCPIGKW
jgi:hypothetical protein